VGVREGEAVKEFEGRGDGVVLLVSIARVNVPRCVPLRETDGEEEADILLEAL